MTKNVLAASSPGVPENLSSMPGAQQLVTRDWVTHLIAERVRSPKEEYRNVYDRVAKRIAYAHKTQKTLAPPVNHRFVFGDVIRWARQKPEWREVLADLPETATPKAPPMPVGADLVVRYDVTLKDCKALLAEKTAQLRAAQDELKQLRPLAEKWKNAQLARARGQQKRRGGTSL